MDWYKDNMALQEELRREYPAVAELIDELEQQLSRYQSKYNNLLAVAHRDGGHYLAQHGEEKAGEAAITAILIAYHSNDRYQGAVEVEGVISSVIRTSDYTEAIVVSITPQCIWGIIDQRVRVLVKEVE